MSYISKNGRVFYIGKNVTMTPVPPDLRETRDEYLLKDSYILEMISRGSSSAFFGEARRDPVALTYALWRFFKSDPTVATERICDLAINGSGKDVLYALEIILFEASPKINAFCLSYIISQIASYVETNRAKVRKAFEKMFFADFATTCRVVKRMYESSPRGTKNIAKNMISPLQYRLIKAVIKPALKLRSSP